MIDHILRKLLAYWSKQNINVSQKLDKYDIKKFENYNNVIISDDMKCYLLATNGMGTRNVSDSDFFSFWPIEDFQRLNDTSSMFIFADVSISSPSFAIELSIDKQEYNHIFAIFSDPIYSDTILIAKSFEMFLTKYLLNAESRSELSAGIPVVD